MTEIVKPALQEAERWEIEIEPFFSFKGLEQRTPALPIRRENAAYCPFSLQS
jgi:hypothetical protein